MSLSDGPFFLITDADSPQTLSGPADVVVGAPPAGLSSGIPYTAPGVWTLAPGKTYLLEARLTADSGAITENVFFWVDTANALVGEMNDGNSRVTANGEGFVRAAFKPLVETQVKLHLTTGTETIHNVEVFIRTLSQ